ncbi:hypothetical protein JW848_05215 [Candidatus Bipolaricaulota bacterium]|nr:hypothetical protein [Candidatus Bipolaricaulota bacterium]
MNRRSGLRRMKTVVAMASVVACVVGAALSTAPASCNCASTCTAEQRAAGLVVGAYGECRSLSSYTGNALGARPGPLSPWDEAYPDCFWRCAVVEWIDHATYAPVCTTQVEETNWCLF